MAFLPPNILLIFQPRPPPTFYPPIEKANLPSYTGLSNFLKSFDDPKNDEPYVHEHIDNIQEAKRKRVQNKEKEANESNQEKIKNWDPYNNPHATGDPYKTLFISRISYKTTEKKLYEEFSQYGTIKNIRLVQGDGQPHHTGYAFIEYDKEKDMKTAYKNAESKKIDDKRILVDIERGRVIKNWKPRKYGGGLGKTRAGGEHQNSTLSNREFMEREKEEKERQEIEKKKALEAPTAPTNYGPFRREEREDRSHPYIKKDRERDRDRDYNHRERDRDRDRERDRYDRHDRDREREKDRDYNYRDRERERSRERGHSRERDRYRSGGSNSGLSSGNAMGNGFR